MTEIYVAREDPLEGVTAKLVVDAVSEARPGMPLAYAADPGRAARATCAGASAAATWW